MTILGFSGLLRLKNHFAGPEVRKFRMACVPKFCVCKYKFSDLEESLGRQKFPIVGNYSDLFLKISPVRQGRDFLRGDRILPADAP